MYHLISVTMAPTLLLLSIIGLFSSIAMVSVVVIADPAKDREECADQLVGLATCLPYVGGNAKAPTPDCCKGLKQVLKNNKKCLCVIVRDRDDPDFGLEINVTLALGLPTVCDAPANVSKCPELLKMDPQSKEAQVFYQLENKNTPTGMSPAPSPTAGAPTSAKGQGVNSSNRTVMNEFGLNAIFVSVLILNLMGLKWFV